MKRQMDLPLSEPQLGPAARTCRSLPHSKPPGWPGGNQLPAEKLRSAGHGSGGQKTGWLLPGLGRRERARLATTWACSCVMLTFSSVTVKVLQRPEHRLRQRGHHLQSGVRGDSEKEF